MKPVLPLPVNKLAAYLALLQKATENKTIESPDGLLEGDAWSLSYTKQGQFPHVVRYRGNYDFEAPFVFGDLVYVTSSFTHMGQTATAASWLCIYPVPESRSLDDIGDENSRHYARMSASCRAYGTNYAPYSGSQYWRIVGGGGSLNYSMYDFNAVYNTNDIVYYTGSTRAFYYHTESRYTYAAHYICQRTIPASGSARTSSFFMPVWPYPSGSGNPESVCYWHMLELYPTIQGVCQEGVVKNYLTNNQEFEPDWVISESLSKATY